MPKRLMPNEPDDATNLEDARVWAGVYAELVDGLTNVKNPSRPVRSRLRAARQRLQWWRSRVDQMTTTVILVV